MHNNRIARYLESTDQPYPTLTQTTRFRAGGVVVTSIARQWAPGDVARCRLCNVCTAFARSCLVSTAGPVGTGRAAALHRTRVVPAG